MLVGFSPMDDITGPLPPIGKSCYISDGDRALRNPGPSANARLTTSHHAKRGGLRRLWGGGGGRAMQVTCDGTQCREQPRGY